MITLKPLDIEDAHAHIVQDALKKHLPDGVRVYAFGSRAAWQAKKASDLDLALDAREGLKSNIADLEEELSQSDLPYKVDIVNLNNIAESFKNAIKPDLVPILWDWEEKRLGDVATLQRGFDLPKKSREVGDYPLMVSNGQDGTHKSYKVKSPGVITGRSGTLGKVFFCKKNFWPLNTTLWVKDFHNNNIKFVYFFLKTLDLEKYNSGSGVPTLNRNHIHPLPVVIPPLEEQEAIGEVLSSLDDKIDLLHRQNKTLEAMAETLFHHHFIENADDSWGEKRLGDILDIKYGKNLPTNKLLRSGYPVFGGNGQIGFYDEYHYEKPQVLVSCRGEASGKVNFSFPKSFITNNSLVLEIRKNSIITFEWLKFYALNMNFRDYTSGSAQPQITIDGLSPAPLILPKENNIKDFTREIKPMEIKILANTKQIQTLEKLRDALLPKLISGKIRVGKINLKQEDII